jgi:hypothetical protein
MEAGAGMQKHPSFGAGLGHVEDRLFEFLFNFSCQVFIVPAVPSGRKRTVMTALSAQIMGDP